MDCNLSFANNRKPFKSVNIFPILLQGKVFLPVALCPGLLTVVLIQTIWFFVHVSSITLHCLGMSTQISGAQNIGRISDHLEITSTYIFVRGCRPAGREAIGSKGDTPTLGWWHCPRHGARPFWELYPPSPPITECPVQAL